MDWRGKRIKSRRLVIKIIILSGVYKISNIVPRKVFRLSNRIKRGKTKGPIPYFSANIFKVRACE